MVSNIYNVFKKDIQYFTNTFSIYIFIAIFILISQWFFFVFIFSSGIGSFDSLVSIIPLMLIFFIPAISVYAFVDEKKSGTLDLLITMPFRYIELIFGKFFVIAYIFFISIFLVFLIDSIILYIYSKPDIGVLFGAFFSIFLYGLVLVSIGIFSSFISNTYIIGYSIAFILSFVYFLLGKILAFFPNYISNILSIFTYDKYFEIISKGIIDTRCIIYFILCILFFIFFTYFLFLYSYIDFNRFTKILYLLSILTFVLSIYFIYNLSSNYYLRFDITLNKIYSLSESTKNILKKLDDVVYIDAYYTSNIPVDISTKKYLKDILEEYKVVSNNIVYEFIDPVDVKLQEKIINEGITPINLSNKSISSINIQRIYMGMIIKYKDKQNVIPVVIDVNDLEFFITSSIYKLVYGSNKNILIVQGDSILDVNKELLFFIESLNKIYNVDTIDINKISNKDIDSTDLIILIDSPVKYSDNFINMIKQAINKNKKLLIFNNPNNVNVLNYDSTPTVDNFKDILSEYGIYRDNAIVVDVDSIMVPIIQKYGELPIINDILYPFFPIISDLNKDLNITNKINKIIYAYGSVLKQSVNNKYNVVSIGKTSSNSFKFIDLNNVIPLQNWEDIEKNSIEKGPFDIGYIVNSGSVVVLGSIYMVSDVIVKLSNSKESLNFVLNIIDKVLSDINIHDIRSTVIINYIQKLSENTQNILKILFIIVFPIIILLIGIIKNIFRRYYTR